MNGIADLAARLEDAGRAALDWSAAAEARKAAREDLTRAYRAYKEQFVGQHIEHGTEEWALMLKLTARQYGKFTAARTVEANAKKRLERACRRAQK